MPTESYRPKTVLNLSYLPLVSSHSLQSIIFSLVLVSLSSIVIFLHYSMNPSPFVRHTFWTTSVLGFYFILSSVGLSQAQYQRLASVKNIQSTQW